MKGGPKLALLFALAALLTSGLAACGSDDSSESTGTSTVTTGASTRTEETTPDEGSGSDEGSDSFLVPGGDNSIQTFGEEASSSELAEADAAVSAYLDARANSDWAAMCADLSEGAIKPLELLADRAPQFKEKGCAAILAALMGRAPAVTRVNTLTSPIAGLRVEGDRGFALYHGAKGVDYFVALAKEDGKWKVAAIAPSELLG